MARKLVGSLKVVTGHVSYAYRYRYSSIHHHQPDRNRNDRHNQDIAVKYTVN